MSQNRSYCVRCRSRRSSAARSSPPRMQVISQRGFGLFLRSLCAFVSDDSFRVAVPMNGSLYLLDDPRASVALLPSPRAMRQLDIAFRSIQRLLQLDPIERNAISRLGAFESPTIRQAASVHRLEAEVMM